MAYDTQFEERINTLLYERNILFSTKKMMGGLVWMVDDKMFCTIRFNKKRNMDLMMARVEEVAMDEALARPGCVRMKMGSRLMKDFVSIDPSGYDMDEDLSYWIDQCQAFNPLAKSSKKKK